MYADRHTVSRLTYSISIDIHACLSIEILSVNRDTVCRSAVVPNCWKRLADFDVISNFQWSCHIHIMSRLMTKPTKWHVRPEKTQISLDIRPVRSESSLSVWRKLGSLVMHWAQSEESDQFGRMSRLIWAFAGRTVILLVLSWGGSHRYECKLNDFNPANPFNHENTRVNIIITALHNIEIWAATCQNQQNECAPSEDSDQPGHPPSLIRVFAVCMKKHWVLSYPLSAQRMLWSDWADAQADLSIRWAHTHFVSFDMSRLIYIIKKIKVHTNME